MVKINKKYFTVLKCRNGSFLIKTIVQWVYHLVWEKLKKILFISFSPLDSKGWRLLFITAKWEKCTKVHRKKVVLHPLHNSLSRSSAFKWEDTQNGASRYLHRKCISQLLQQCATTKNPTFPDIYHEIHP